MSSGASVLASPCAEAAFEYCRGPKRRLAARCLSPDERLPLVIKFDSDHLVHQGSFSGRGRSGRRRGRRCSHDNYRLPHRLHLGKRGSNAEKFRADAKAGTGVAAE